jgi:hypothetical protein
MKVGGSNWIGFYQTFDNSPTTFDSSPIDILNLGHKKDQL